MLLNHVTMKSSTFSGMWAVCSHSQTDDKGKEENGGDASPAKSQWDLVSISSVNKMIWLEDALLMRLSCPQMSLWFY